MFLLLVQWWILVSAAVSLAGWVLSYFHALNGKGYLLFLIAFGILAGFSGHALPYRPVRWGAELKKLGKRFQRLAPFLFLAMVVLSLLGGLLYEPMHGDSQSYRVPRVLHWLWENRWHWIHTGDVRSNVVAPGVEWFWAPGFLILPGERWLFLYNVISLLFLPGLLFALFRELGVRPRVAWWWMWILPAGYSYALQAGGISTDAYATPYALAAVAFALRGRRSGSLREMLASLVAAALMTGAKQTNLLLLPLWFVPFALNWRVLLKKPVLTAATAVLAVGASCLPISYLNTRYAGNWQGFTDTRNFVPHSLIYGVVGNALAVPAQNLLPPVFPLADKWNAAMQKFRGTPAGSHFEGFEDFGHLYRMPSDATGGLGLVICLLVLWSLVTGSKRCAPPAVSLVDRLLHLTYGAGPWLLLVVFMAKVGTATNARYLATIYPFLLVPVLWRSRANYRSVAWRSTAYFAGLVTIFLLISSRQRPLFPVQTICSAVHSRFPRLSAIEKVKNAYAYFQEHSQLMNQLASALPQGEQTVGYATDVGFLESALWLPFCSRKVARLTGGEGREAIASEGIRYLVVEQGAFRAAGATNANEWLSRYNAKIVESFPLRRLGPEAPVETVYLVKLQ